MTVPGSRARDKATAQYVEDAVPFVVRSRGGAAALRVARTLLTCRVAARALNELYIPAEDRSTYALVNVHNPACPLFFDKALLQWRHAPDLADHPVCGINWTGAVLLSQHLGARLPTVAEWESFASNNDPTRRYPWGNAAPTDQAANFGEHLGGTSPVDRFPPSEIGLRDLAGNLCEWCADCPATGSGARLRERVVKGGAWSKGAQHLLIRAGRGKWERIGTTTIGLRPVWDD